MELTIYLLSIYPSIYLISIYLSIHLSRARRSCGWSPSRSWRTSSPRSSSSPRCCPASRSSPRTTGLFYLKQVSIYLSIYLSTIVQCTLTKDFWLNWDLEILQVCGSFWTKRFKRIQRGMIQQKVLTAGHPTLYFCYKSKPLYTHLFLLLKWQLFSFLWKTTRNLSIYCSVM